MEAGLTQHRRGGGTSGRGRRRLRRTLAAAALLGLAAAVSTWLAWPAPAPHADTVPAASVDAYRGLGAWVDLYDTAAWRHPTAAVRDMHAHHVRTLFLETANYGWPTSVAQRSAVSAFISACHARDMRIVAWYLPDFRRGLRDYRRSMAAISFHTPDGQRFDSFSLDIEASIVKPASVRSHRLIVLSQRLRTATGPSYALGAIIPSPVGMTRSASYWRGFPYARLAGLYDVMAPMGYYSYHGRGAKQAYQETLSNVAIIRDQTGDPAVPIHVIGGLAENSSGAETQAFVRATRETGVIGASLYDWATSDAADWAALGTVRDNPVEQPAMPVDLGYAGPLGQCPGDALHPKEVFFQAPGQDGDRVLSFQLYDAQTGEVHLLVDWHDLGALPAGPVGEWSATQQVTVPAADLDPTGRNVVGFVARGAYPLWSTWGVQGVALSAP
jgi:hypothetical protein